FGVPVPRGLLRFLVHRRLLVDPPSGGQCLTCLNANSSSNFSGSPRTQEALVDDLTRPHGPTHRFLETGLRRALDDHDRALWSEIDRATEGGKRFRPRLLLGAHTAFGGQQARPAQRVAEALELLHTAFV